MEELYDLDINEIESITVLKDASATALYGSRAANGVIVIERKKLAEGNMRVSYNFTANVQFPYLKDYDVLNAAEKLEYERLSGLYTAEQNQYGDLDLNKEQYRLDELYNKYYQEIARGVDSDWLSQPHGWRSLMITLCVFTGELLRSVTSCRDVLIIRKG